MIKGTVYKKVRDEGNILGWDLIELLERRPSNHTTVVTVEKKFGPKDPQYKQSETGLYQETTTVTPCDWVIRCTNGDGSVDINSMDEDDLYESLMDAFASFTAARPLSSATRQTRRKRIGGRKRRSNIPRATITTRARSLKKSPASLPSKHWRPISK